MSDTKLKSEIEKFLKEKNIVFRVSDPELQMNCPLCSDTRERMGINYNSGFFNCFNCESNGKKFSSFKYAVNNKSKINTKDNIEKTEREEVCKIKPDFHSKFQKMIHKKSESGKHKYGAYNYLLKERKLTKECIEHFNFGTRTIFKTSEGKKYNAGEHLAIPYIKDGKCVNIKYRALDPNIDKKNKWRREKGGISTLYNDSVIDNLDYTDIIIAESEIDCASLWSLGFKNVIGLTTGAKAFKQQWYERLLRFEKIYIVLDGDKDGQEGAKKLAKRLGLGRCFNVIMPDDVKDPNDYIKKYDKLHFEGLLNKASQYDVEKVRSLGNILSELYDTKFNKADDEEKNSIIYTTHWPKVNKVLGPVKPGFLWVLAGKPKSGKTTLALNLMLEWGYQGINTAIYTCEMRDARLAERWVMMETPEADSFENITREQFRYAQHKLPIQRLRTFYPTEPSELELDNVCDRVEQIIDRYGTELMVIDNLHFLCRGEDENVLISKATQRFKLLGEKKDCVIILITHPRKINHNKQMKNEDLKGSSSIIQDADIIWLMFRKALDGDILPEEAINGDDNQSMSPRADILITSRWSDGGKTWLVFDGKRGIFKDKGTEYNKIAEEMGQGQNRKQKSNF